jgi:serine/threonine-protein kinase
VAEVTPGALVDGRYDVLRRLGSGGMADVWLADDRHLQRRVALKVLHARFAQDREFVERFRREAESAAGLQHPNVVAVFDRGSWDGSYYIAMQYVEGRTLKELIDAGLTPEQAVPLIRQVLEAARFAHRHGIVHRDLKPQNVIVDPEGKAVVTDFGIARAGVSEITQVGAVMGTPHYLSPEQAQGMEVTAVSDLYSIGVMLYEALTRTVPFEGDSAVAIAMKQVSQTPPLPSSIDPRVSTALDAVVARALQKDPAQRFQSADAFIAALDAALAQPAAGGTAAFAPPPVEEPPPEYEERRRGWIAALVALAILIGALVGLALTRDTTTGVPDVTGNQLGVAIELLHQDGFTVGPPKFVERQAARNTVLEQDPAASPPGRQASEDCALLSFFCSKPEVTLTVSGGPGKAKVPPTAGLERGEAVERLREAGFQPQLRTVHSGEVEEGVVIHSEPSAGTVATRGTSVTLYVSRGPRRVKVPVLVGSQRSVAVQEIRGLGLSPDVAEEESRSPAGQVIGQSPSAGAVVDPGSIVSITVSEGEARSQVPNVIGKLRGEAVAALRAAKLEPNVQERETEVPSQIGRVTDQFPPPGSELEPGSAVTIVVGKRAGAPEPVEEPEEPEEAEAP